MSYPNIILTTDPNLSFAQYDFIQIVHDENNYIEARVVSYNTSTGELIASPIHHHGSGSFNDWKIMLAGEPGTGSTGTSGQSGTSGTSVSTNLLSSVGWNTNKEYQVGNTEQLTFAGDYILNNSDLYIEGSEESIEYSQNKLAKKAGKIYIGGNLIIKDSTIENNGEIGVGGSVILIGNSQITGTGIII